MVIFFLMLRRPPRSTRTYTLFPYTTLFRSVRCRRAQLRQGAVEEAAAVAEAVAGGVVADQRGDDDAGHHLRTFGGHRNLPHAVGHLDAGPRSEERRVGKEGVSTCKSRCSTYH